MSRKTPVMERIVAGVTMFIAFIVMASIFVPEHSEAESDDHATGHATGDTGTPGDHHLSTDPHADLKSLGSIDHRSYRAVIYATEDGPRYSVYDRETGEELGVLMSAERVALHFPELPIPDMDLGEVQLMMVDPQRE